MNSLPRLMCGLAWSALPIAGLGAVTPMRVPAAAWEIGPVIDGHNYSRGLASPSQFAYGWGFTIGPTSEPHYVTFSYGSLTGRREIRMRFRVDGPPGALVYGANCPGRSPSAVTLYFQARGDDWSSDGFRWWATFATVPIAGPMGETEIEAPLDANWTSVNIMSGDRNPAEFAAAKTNAGRVGFTFANCDGYGHGARATAPVRFVVTEFEVT